MNNTSGNTANYMVSFDLALVSGVTEGFAPPRIEFFSEPGISAAGFNIDDSLLTAGGGFQHYSYLLSDGDLVFGHAEPFEPRVPSYDVAFVFLGFPANVDQMGQTYLIDNVKIEIAPIPVVDLTLVVNKTTEEIKVRNDTAGAISFDYYAIESAMNALSPAGWNSLEDQGVGGLSTDFNGDSAVNGADLTVWRSSYGVDNGADADGDGDSDGGDFLAWQRSVGQTPGPADGWIEAGASNSSVIGELLLNGATTLGPGEEVSLGAAYNNSVFGANNGDLVFRVSTGDSTALGMGQVTYVTSATAAASAVPEPASIGFYLAAFGVIAWKRR
jgi:hypothetical protein